jgi:hypothetical protein
MSSAAPVVSPIFAFYEKLSKLKGGDKATAAKYKLSKKTRDTLSQMLKLYNVNLMKEFGVADFAAGQSKMGKKEVEALEYISAKFMAIADFVMQVSNDEGDDFDALCAAGIPQLISYQLAKGAMCHNEVAKEMSEMLAKIG